jgi:hypothetical protein
MKRIYRLDERIPRDFYSGLYVLPHTNIGILYKNTENFTGFCNAIGFEIKEDKIKYKPFPVIFS